MKSRRTRACKDCGFIVHEGTTCPACGSTSLSPNWEGHVCIIDLTSQLASMIRATKKGVYAVIVRP